jgi:hypothetical protein
VRVDPRFGFKIPCLVRGDGEIVDRHLRLKAARKLGITEIPVGSGEGVPADGEPLCRVGGVG